MNCRRIQRLISAYIDGELPGADMILIRNHVNDCSECSREFQSILSVKRSMSSLAPKQPSQSLAVQICERLNYAPTHKPGLAWTVKQHVAGISLSLRLAGVAAGLAAIAILFNYGTAPQPNAYVYSPQQKFDITAPGAYQGNHRFFSTAQPSVPINVPLQPTNVPWNASPNPSPHISMVSSEVSWPITY